MRPRIKGVHFSNRTYNRCVDRQVRPNEVAMQPNVFAIHLFGKGLIYLWIWTEPKVQ